MLNVPLASKKSNIIYWFRQQHIFEKNNKNQFKHYYTFQKSLNCENIFILVIHIFKLKFRIYDNLKHDKNKTFLKTILSVVL